MSSFRLGAHLALPEIMPDLLPRPPSPVQLAADAEAAKAKQGRGVLGELERGALGKGKVQAASVRKLRSSMSGARQAVGCCCRGWVQGEGPRGHGFLELSATAGWVACCTCGPPASIMACHQAAVQHCHLAFILQTLPAWRARMCPTLRSGGGACCTAMRACTWRCCRYGTRPKSQD